MRYPPVESLVAENVSAEGAAVTITSAATIATPLSVVTRPRMTLPRCAPASSGSETSDPSTTRGDNHRAIELTHGLRDMNLGPRHKCKLRVRGSQPLPVSYPSHFLPEVRYRARPSAEGRTATAGWSGDVSEYSRSDKGLVSLFVSRRALRTT